MKPVPPMMKTGMWFPSRFLLRKMLVGLGVDGKSGAAGLV